VNAAAAEDYETICRFFAAQGTTAGWGLLRWEKNAANTGEEGFR